MKPRSCDSIWFVYILRDEHSNPIYIGCTRDVTRRVKTHRYKPYWPSVANVSVEVHTERDRAFQREAELIRDLDPPHNADHRQWRPDPGQERCFYFRFCGAAATHLRFRHAAGRKPQRMHVCEDHKGRRGVPLQEGAAA